MNRTPVASLQPRHYIDWATGTPKQKPKTGMIGPRDWKFLRKYEHELRALSYRKENNAESCEAMVCAASRQLRNTVQLSVSTYIYTAA
jgi:hypothetical protein